MTTASFKVSEFLSEINDGELLNHKVDLKKKKDKFIAELATKHLIDKNTLLYKNQNLEDFQIKKIKNKSNIVSKSTDFAAAEGSTFDMALGDSNIKTSSYVDEFRSTVKHKKPPSNISDKLMKNKTKKNILDKTVLDAIVMQEAKRLETKARLIVEEANVFNERLNSPLRYVIPESHHQSDHEENNFNAYLRSDLKVPRTAIPVGTSKRVSKMMINVQKIDPKDTSLLKHNHSSNSLQALLQQEQANPLTQSSSSPIIRTLTLDHFLSEHKNLYQSIKKFNSTIPADSTVPVGNEHGIILNDDTEVLDNKEVSNRLQLIHKEAIKNRLTIEKTIEILQAKGWNTI